MNFSKHGGVSVEMGEESDGSFAIPSAFHKGSNFWRENLGKIPSVDGGGFLPNVEETLGFRRKGGFWVESSDYPAPPYFTPHFQSLL